MDHGNTLAILLDIENLGDRELNSGDLLNAIDRWAKEKSLHPEHKIAFTARREYYDRRHTIFAKFDYKLALASHKGENAADYSLIKFILTLETLYDGINILVVSGDHIFREYLMDEYSIEIKKWLLSPNLDISAKIYRLRGAYNFLVWHGNVILPYWQSRCIFERHDLMKKNYSESNGDFCVKCDSILQQTFYCYHCKILFQSCRGCNVNYFSI